VKEIGVIEEQSPPPATNEPTIPPVTLTTTAIIEEQLPPPPATYETTVPPVTLTTSKHLKDDEILET